MATRTEKKTKAIHQNIEDILNATDSDDSDVDTDHVDLELLLGEDDDEDTIDLEFVSSDLPYDDGFMIDSNKDVKGFSIEDENADYSDTSAYELSKAIEEVDSEEADLTGLSLADRREKRFLQAGVRDVISALRSKRIKQETLRSADTIVGMSSDTTSNAQTNLRCNELETLSSQLKRNASYKQHGPGLATAIYVHLKFIAVGTSRGLVLLFDHAQEIRQVIGSSTTGTSRCMQGVTAVVASAAGNLLLCGHETGELALWEVLKGTLLKRATDLHQQAICRLQFVSTIGENFSVPSTASDVSAISVDTKGMVHRVKFTKLLWSSYSTDADCLLDGSAGPISDMSTLPSLFETMGISHDGPWRSQFLQPLSARGALQFVAFNSKSKSFIVQLQPAIKIVYRWPFPALAVGTESVAQNYRAALDWSWSVPSAPAAGSPAGGDSSVGSLPLLARTWGEFVEILTVSSHDDNTLSFTKTCERAILGYNFLAVKWMSAGASLALLSATEILIVRQSLETVEKALLLPMVALELRPLIDAAQEAAAATTAHRDKSTITVHNQNLYLLCSTALVYYHIQSWVEQVDQLIRDGKWLEALSVVLENWGNRSSSSDQGKSELGSDPVADASLARDRGFVDRYIKKYTDLAISQSAASPTSRAGTPQSRNHYHLVAGVCIEYCVTARRTELLFGDLFDTFLAARQDSVFLESLEPYILSRAITQLPQPILSSLLESAAASRRLLALERCIVYLNLATNDIEAVVDFLYKNSMVSGFLFAKAFAAGDFAAAFHTIFTKFVSGVTPADVTAVFPSPEQANVGYKLLLFLWYVSEGKVFPCEDPTVINSQQLAALTELVCSATLEASTPITPIGSDAAAESDSLLEGVNFPYLTMLWKVDSRAVVFCVTKALKSLHDCSKTGRNYELRRFPSVSAIYSSCFEFILASDAATNSKEGELSFFENCLMQLVDCATPLSQTLLVCLVRYSATTIQPRSHAEELMVTLATRQSKSSQVAADLRKVLQENDFWRATLALQNRKQHGYQEQEFRAAIKAYLRLQTRLQQSERSGETAPKEAGGPAGGPVTFDYIDAQFAAMAADNVSHTTVTDFCRCVAEALPELTPLDQKRAQAIVCGHLSAHCSDVITSTKKHLHIQFLLLNAMISAVRGDTTKDLTEAFTPAEVLAYIRLLLAFQPQDVYAFVTTVDHYPLDDCLAMCKEKEVYDATAYLLERAGDATGALDLLHMDLSRSIQAAKREVEQLLRQEAQAARSAAGAGASGALGASPSGVVSQILGKQGAARAEAATKLQCFKGLQHIAGCAAGICQRHSSKGNAAMWFSTFDYLMKERQTIRQGSTVSSSSEVVVMLIGLLLQSFMAQMKGTVPPQDIIRRVASQPQGQAAPGSVGSVGSVGSGSRFAEFKDVMISMVDTYRSDLFLENLLLKMHTWDLHCLQAAKRNKSRQAERVDPEMLAQENAWGEEATSSPADSTAADADETGAGAGGVDKPAPKRSPRRVTKQRRAVNSREHPVHRLREVLKSSGTQVGRNYSVTLFSLSPPPSLSFPDFAEAPRSPGSLPRQPAFVAQYG